MHHSARIAAAAMVLVLGLSACADSTGPEDGARVTLAFSMSAEASAQSAVMEEVVVTGANGTLIITDVAFVVSELKLERSGDACEIATEDDDDCERFETGREFVQLPLSGATAAVVTSVVPAGTYTELKFEVADANRHGPGDITSLLIDLSAFDFATSGALLDFEAKMEHGFTKIELEGFDD